mmetsp:Transcript_9189/g.15458  ORF Transcript_9189/g.15458 Transcript_9189/m.15458 type:complete len:91 (-) Transcript_9189:85-357(-)
MERDCMISHGSARFLKERTMDASDKYRVHICDICGLICEAHLTKNIYRCKGCDNEQKISAVNIPYASKLLFQELMSLMISPRIVTGFFRR